MDGFRKKLISSLNNIQSFKDLILHSVLSNHLVRNNNYLEELISLSDIKLTNEIPTAAIKYNKYDKFVLLFNPKFIKKYIFTEECFLFVLLHELCHKIFGDLFLKISYGTCKVNDKILNIVYDLVINTFLYKNVFYHSVEFIKNFYNNTNSWLEKLFLPPDILMDKNLLQKIYHFGGRKCIYNRNVYKQLANIILGKENLNSNEYIQQMVSETYYDLWLNTELGTEELSISEVFIRVITLISTLSPYLDIKIYIPLIGEHTCSENPEYPGNLPSWFVDLLKKIKGELNQAGYSNKLYENKIERIIPKENIRFYNAIITALSASNIPVLKEQQLPEHGFIPQFTRKEIYLLSSGVVPIIYQTSIEKKEYDDMKVHLYIDLSGTTQSEHKIFYELVLAIHSAIGMPVYGFSNKVVELTLDDLKNGKIRTTWGTDIDCVIEHAISKKFHRIMLITDGYVQVKEQNVTAVKENRMEIFVIFTKENKSSVLFTKKLVNIKDMNRRWWCMEDIFKH